MIKMSLISITFLVCIVKSTQANCPETDLYCFNSNDFRIGEIKVQQCWKWSRLSCQPCKLDNLIKLVLNFYKINHFWFIGNYDYLTTSTGGKISFQKYLQFCQIFYPNTVQVLDTKSVWTANYWKAKNEQFNGK